MARLLGDARPAGDASPPPLGRPCTRRAPELRRRRRHIAATPAGRRFRWWHLTRTFRRRSLRARHVLPAVERTEVAVTRYWTRRPSGPAGQRAVGEASTARLDGEGRAT